MDGPITALQTLDCDWSVHKFTELNFSELTDNNQIFRNDFDWIHYHLCKISSQIIECKFFAPCDFLEIELSITTHSMIWSHFVRMVVFINDFCNAMEKNELYYMIAMWINSFFIWDKSCIFFTYFFIAFLYEKLYFFLVEVGNV